ncbi:pentatricopeptide repeat-containing protein [Striga asiatica]|uniref:Pentatricopeptide repeat-containing protein n=1 Tax=Striga asiatica TaxID=4170 RepID=A0A5A7PT93_STRAF|nr:pentatricopeptide repeat-containing protein [Striga asiatica]
MQTLTSSSNESRLIKSVCSIVIKGCWDRILKPKIGSLVTSSVTSQAILNLSPHGFSFSWPFFKWVEAIPQYKHSLPSCWIMICVLTKHRHFRTAQSLLEKVARREFLSSPTVLNALVGSYVDPDVNSHVLSWLVIFCANSKTNRDALQVFDHMRVCGYKPHLHACTVLLNSLVKERLTDTVWKTYKKMTKIGVVPNLHVYNVLIHACCKSGDFEKAEGFLTEMESKNIFPDLFTYNTLISMYCKKTMHYEALCVQERMKISGISPDIVTYNSLIYSYSREGRVREALRLFKEIKGGVLPNHVTYTTLIDGFCRAGDINEALKLRELMESKELYPGVVTFNAILRRLCEEGRIQDANRLLNEMGERKIEPDNVTCNTLINAYCKIGDMRSALKVKGKMIEGGLRPDQFTYRALVHGFCKAREVNNAKEMLFDMIRAGFFPSSCTYAWLVDFYCGENDFNGILGLPAELAGKGILVDVSVYRAIIRRLCKRERVDCAEKMFTFMQEMGILGDTVIFANMAYAYFRGGDDSSFSAFLDEMYRRRLIVTLKIFRNINASYANDRDCLDMFWSALLDRGLISKSIYKQMQQ